MKHYRETNQRNDKGSTDSQSIAAEQLNFLQSTVKSTPVCQVYFSWNVPGTTRWVKEFHALQTSLQLHAIAYWRQRNNVKIVSTVTEVRRTGGPQTHTHTHIHTLLQSHNTELQLLTCKCVFPFKRWLVRIPVQTKGPLLKWIQLPWRAWIQSLNSRDDGWRKTYISCHNTRLFFFFVYTYLLTYLLHGAESFLRS